MDSRKMIYGGIIIIVMSIFIPMLFGLWDFYQAFQALRTNQTAGFGAVGGFMEKTIFSGLFMILGILTGTIFIIIGNYKKGTRTQKID